MNIIKRFIDWIKGSPNELQEEVKVHIEETNEREGLLKLYGRIYEFMGVTGIFYKVVGERFSKFDFRRPVSSLDNIGDLRYGCHYHIVQNGKIDPYLSTEGIKRYVEILTPIVDKMEAKNKSFRLRINTAMGEITDEEEEYEESEEENA